MSMDGRNGARAFVRPDDLAISDAAQTMREALERIIESREAFGSVSLALAELDLAADEARDDGWDGYEGVALDRATYAWARRILLALPLHLPAPEVAADPRGGVVLSWRGAPGRDFVLAIRRSGQFTYASVRGPSGAKGYETGSPDLPPAILCELERTIAPAADVP